MIKKKKEKHYGRFSSSKFRRIVRGAANNSIAFSLDIIGYAVTICLGANENNQ